MFPSPEESEASPQVHPFPDHELEDMKMKISALKSEIQKEVSHGLGLFCTGCPKGVGGGAAGLRV